MDEELKMMSDRELAKRMLFYIDSLRRLMQKISDYLERKRPIPNREDIRFEYKRLKKAIKVDAHYLDLVRNQTRERGVYSNFYVPSVAEASAYGFTSSTNSQIDQRFYSSASEAHYRLTKYHSREKWSAIAEMEDL